MIISFMKNLPPVNEDDFSPLVENMPGPIGGMYAIQEVKLFIPKLLDVQVFKVRFLYRHLLMKLELLFTQKF